MKSLLKEFAAFGDAQADLKTSDGSDAGRGDVASKPVDVRFNLMRNMINTENGVTGSDVNDYLERAQELNDEVDTVGFALEDDDGEIIKVYVNAQQASEFEEEMSKLLGLDDDLEAAINTMAQKYDIVDVVWPEEPADGSENADDVDPDADLTIDSEPDAFNIEDPTPDETDPEAKLGGELEADALPADDEDDAPAADAADDTAAAADDDAPATDDEPADDAPADDEASTDDDTSASADDEGDEEAVEDDEELEPVLDDNGEQKLDKDGNPVMRKKRKKKEDTEASAEENAGEPEVTEEGLRDDILAHVAAHHARGDKGKFYIETLVTGGYGGRRRHAVTREGKVFYFTDRAQAVQEAERLSKMKNRAGATASYKYEVKLKEGKEPIELDAIRKGLKPIMAKAAKVNSQEDYDAFLKGFGAHAKVVDQHVNPDSIDKTADKLHYYQKDADVAAFLKKYVLEGVPMSIGAKFLNRVLAEAEDTDGVKDGMNIPLDSQQRLLANRLKRPAEKRIVAMFAMAGVLGRLLTASDGIEESVAGAADMLRKNRSALTAFNAFYTALAQAKGYGAKAAVAESVIAEAKLKRGSALQKKFETILVKLGLPEDLVATDGPGAIGPALFKTTKLIDADGNLQSLMNKLAIRLGISGSDVNAPLDDTEKKPAKPGEKVEEAVDVGNDEWFQTVAALAVALGIPEKNLAFQRPGVVKSMRDKKMSLTNRGMIETRMQQLLQLIEKGTRKAPAAQQAAPAGQQANEENVVLGYFGARNILKEAQLMEAFGDLEAMTNADLSMHSVDEPNGGPAMMAAYEGAGAHEDTILVVGIDPDATEPRNLVVSIDGPWDGNLHRRAFTNDKAGYKAALDYANMLRTANLKSGGKPRGWKDEPKVAVKAVAVDAEV